MDFDTAKENIQPLASGRNAEQLETALIAESDQETQQRLYEQRKEFERAIESYTGDDPLQPWYDYIVWVEQVYPKSGKESAFHELLSRCLAYFERDERYFQDRRMVKLYIKYIDSEPNPPQFYEQLYNNGIGTMVADLYLCWAHYYDYCDNFEKADGVYRKGLDARAQPIELIEQAHRQFGFSMSQRILYKDESTQKEFRSSMDEQRLALTSLRAHKHRHVGSIRTGSAVKSYNPGRVDVQGSTSRQSNRQVQVFEDDGIAPPTSPTASTSVVQSILNSTKKQENLREPGPWNKAKIKSNALFSGACSSKPSFSILEDDDIPPIPLPDSENYYARGIQLPDGFVRKNFPQEEFEFPLHRDDEPSKKKCSYKYDKFMVFPAPNKCYSLEELWAYKWFKKRNIKNNFTRTQDEVWENGFPIPIRLPPHFVRKNEKQEDFTPPPFDVEEALSNGKRQFGFDIHQIYTTSEEYSPEEILQAKWLNGELVSQKNAEMEITCGFERREENFKRRSMAVGGRKSILPRRSNSPRKSIATRKSLAAPQAPPQLPPIEEPKPSTSNTDTVPTGATKKCLPKRKSVYSARTLDALSTIPESASPPSFRRKLNEDEETVEERPPPNSVKFNIFEDSESAEARNNDQVFKVPQSAPVQKGRASIGFQDEGDLDGCTTQTFNFFIKSQSISTPKVSKPYAKFTDSDGATSMRKGLDFDDEAEDASANEIDSNAPEIKQPFAIRSDDPEPPYIAEPHEMYRQKLSAIMETTEECATVSSLAATASSKSSSAEDFDYTKSTNHQSSVAMSTYRQHTIINNTAKTASSLNVSTATNRGNESKKVSALGFEIYQEDDVNANDAAAHHVSVIVSKNADTSKVLSLQQTAAEGFDKTLPPAGQFHIYEDDQKDGMDFETETKKEDTTLTKETSVKNTEGEKSQFEISKAETQPPEWSSKTLTSNDVSVVPYKSIVEATKPVEIASNEPHLVVNIDLPKVTSKPAFQIYQEDTGVNLPTINFNEERTEILPPTFNAYQGNLTQFAPPERTEPVSIYAPEMPELDATKNMSKVFEVDCPKIQPPKTTDQSAVYNQSVFVFQEDETTNVFAMKFNGDKTEPMSKIPNPMQISLINTDGNTSAFPMIPDMPTLPDIDFESKQNQNESVAGQKVAETTLKTNDKTMANQSVFNASQMDYDVNQSRMFINKTVAEKTLNEVKTNDIKEVSICKQNRSHAAQPDSNQSVFCMQNDDDEEEEEKEKEKEKENLQAEKSIKNTTTQKPTIEIDSPTIPTEKSLVGINSFKEKSKTAIDDELYASINPTMQADKSNAATDQSILSKSKNNIDDEFYAMIKSPVSKTERTLAQGMIIIDTPSPEKVAQNVRESVVNEMKLHKHRISKLREPSMSLLEPMKYETIRESTVPDAQNLPTTGRKSSMDDTPRAFSDDNPNTAMFSLHMPFIKNSTILIQNIDEECGNITNVKDESMVAIKEEAKEEKPQDLEPVETNVLATSTAAKEVSKLNLNSIHIKEERLSIENKAVDEIKHTDIEDTNAFLNLSIQLTSTEIAAMQNAGPNFMICNPISIRPSQFPMNETKCEDITTKNLKDFPLDISLSGEEKAAVQADQSLIVVEDTEDLSAVCKKVTATSKARRDTVNRYNANPKLNETISAAKEIEPFDIHLQNALLDDIDFIEYIKDLEYVDITTRVRAIEVDTDVEICGENYTILKQIGQGSFGFVYRGKCTKTGKMHAFKQERPANLWEFYISLEIATRVEDANILPGFMSVERATIGHNSSIFVMEYCEYGSLFDVCNKHKLNTCRYLDEVIAMMFSEQMLSILDHLHASNIIHGDIKPDNFLLMKKLSYGNNEIVIKLIDFGRSIDLNFFPPNQTFTSTLNTKNFVCTEMLENKPWKYQIDLFCLASTMYTLVCGKYMNIKKQPESKIRPYVLSESLAPYLNVQLWEHVFYSLINVRDHNTLPDLQKLRLQIREAIVENEHIVQDKIAKFNAVLDF